MWNCRSCYTDNRRLKQQTGWKNVELQRFLRYGVTPDQFSEAEEQANGICKLCELEKELLIDHCHESGKFRGLICRECNLMLGHAKDKIPTLQRAIDYLKEHGR